MASGHRQPSTWMESVVHARCERKPARRGRCTHLPRAGGCAREGDQDFRARRTQRHVALLPPAGRERRGRSGVADFALICPRPGSKCHLHKHLGVATWTLTVISGDQGPPTWTNPRSSSLLHQGLGEQRPGTVRIPRIKRQRAANGSLGGDRTHRPPFGRRARCQTGWLPSVTWRR